jgi:hypothetical protein
MFEFHIGQTVVCIDDKKIPSELFSSIPKEGEKYIIRDLYIGHSFENTSEYNIGVRLEGIIGTFHFFFQHERGFKSTRFRPLDDLESYIEKLESDIISSNYDKLLDLEENPYKVKEKQNVY